LLRFLKNIDLLLHQAEDGFTEWNSIDIESGNLLWNILSNREAMINSLYLLISIEASQ
jgi:hypothetical protein